MKLTCPECGATISASHINIQALVAVCATCDAVFRVDVQSIGPAPMDGALSLPNQMSLSEADRALAWRNRGSRMAGIAMCILGSLLGSVGLVLSSGLGSALTPTMLFASVAAGLGYTGLALVFNRWRITWPKPTINF